MDLNNIDEQYIPEQESLNQVRPEGSQATTAKTLNPYEPVVPTSNPVTQETGMFRDIADRFSSTRAYQSTISNKSGRDDVVDDVVANQVFLLQSNDLLPNDVKASIFKEGGDYSAEYLNYLRANPDYVNQVKQIHPELGLKSYNEIYDDTIKTFNDISRQQQIDSDKTTGMGWLGAIAGGVVGFLQDPVNAAVAVGTGGFGFGRTVLATAAKTIGIEALANAGLEARNKPGEVLVRESLGEKLSTGDVLAESGINIAASAGLAGLITGLSKGIELHVKGSKERLQLEDAKEAVQNIKDTIGDVPKGMEPQQYGQAIENAYKKQIAGDNIDSSAFMPGLKPLEADPIVTKESLDALYDTKRNASKFDDLYNQFKENDRVTTAKDTLGNEISYSFKAELEGLKDAEVTQKLLDTCLSGAKV